MTWLNLGFYILLLFVLLILVLRWYGIEIVPTTRIEGMVNEKKVVQPIHKKKITTI
jgi:hypothetical protein